MLHRHRFESHRGALGLSAEEIAEHRHRLHAELGVVDNVTYDHVREGHYPVSIDQGQSLR